MKVENVKVYGLENAVRCSKFPMQTDTSLCTTEVTKTTDKLAMCGLGEAHDNFLNGIIVQFDLTFSNKAWVELQRYHFIDFISSQSTMHRITKFNLDEAYNEYVDSHTDWIGKIPSTWRILKSKHIFDRVNNRTQTGDEELLSVSEYYGVKPKKETIKEGEFISRSDSLINYKKCSRNDLVMNIMLAWKKGLGISDYDGIVSPAYEVFNLNTEIVFPKYIDYLFRTDMYTTEFKRHSYGVIDSRLRLYPDNFKEIECILPPIKEQEQIV